MPSYDGILVVGFGGPEGRDEVIPFLENVLRGRNVPRERMLEVAEHYYHFDGVSPINAQVRELIAALRTELDTHGVSLPVYWGNRNWHPMLADAIRQMTDDGIENALGLVLAGYSSYSSCRQYREDIERARGPIGPKAPGISKIRVFYNHPDFIAASADRLRAAFEKLPPERRGTAHVAFTAHSSPSSMAATCNYEKQLTETCRLVAESLGASPDRWQLVYQSRSGRPTDPWLGPDICDHLRSLKEQGGADVVIMPVGFLSDHMEILFDLDEEARGVSAEIGLNMVRASTVGTHPQFVAMLRKLIVERMTDGEKQAIGQFGPNHDVCPIDCCPSPMMLRRM